MKLFFAKVLSAFFLFYYSLRYWRRVSFGRGVIINHRFSFHGPGRLYIGDYCRLWAHEEPNRFMTFSREARITIGKNCRINGATFQCKTKIVVDEDTLIASAMLIDTDFHSTDWQHWDDPAYIKSKPIHVGDHVWICGQAAILKGVTVGSKSVVGFRAVVTKDVPEKTLVAGNPAVVVRTLSTGHLD